jgi:hypothetical protein
MVVRLITGIDGMELSAVGESLIHAPSPQLPHFFVFQSDTSPSTMHVILDAVKRKFSFGAYLSGKLLRGDKRHLGEMSRSAWRFCGLNTRSGRGICHLNSVCHRWRTSVSTPAEFVSTPANYFGGTFHFSPQTVQQYCPSLCEKLLRNYESMILNECHHLIIRGIPLRGASPQQGLSLNGTVPSTWNGIGLYADLKSHDAPNVNSKNEHIKQTSTC